KSRGCRCSRPRRADPKARPRFRKSACLRAQDMGWGRRRLDRTLRAGCAYLLALAINVADNTIILWFASCLSRKKRAGTNPSSAKSGGWIMKAAWMISASLVGLAMAHPASAQDASPPAADPQSSAQSDVGTDEASSDDGEIIVTATRRSERLRDVPLSITAFS